MLRKFLAPGDWFAPKRFGYGSGLPIAWQGWIVLALFMAGAIVPWLIPPAGEAGATARIGGTIVLVILFAIICARRTRGGWHWRWGGD